MTHHRIGITGCNGFIGSHLQSVLTQHKIDFTCFKGDLLNKNDVETFFKEATPESIIHLAGTFSPPFENQMKLNVLTTQNLLDVGVNYRLKKIIYASSGAVYGEPVNEESSETDELHPNTLYGLSKKFAEDCIQYYHTYKGVEYIILRFPNVYGKGNLKGVIYNFLNQIHNSKKITIEGDGTQSRNFLHVSDACQAIFQSLSYPGSEIFNISNPHKVTINELVSTLKEHYEFEVTYTPNTNDLKDLLLNVTKAKQLLHFEPQIIKLLIEE